MTLQFDHALHKSCDKPGSGPADEIALTVDVLARGARAVTTDEAVRHADIIALAVPTHRFRDLPPAGYSSTR